MTVKSDIAKSQIYISDGVATEYFFFFRVFFVYPWTVQVYVKRASDGVEYLLPDASYQMLQNPAQENNPGGRIILNLPIPAGDKLVIVSATPYHQIMYVRFEERFNSDTWNDGMDRLEMQILQLKEQLDRCAKMTVLDERTADEFMTDFWTAAQAAIDARNEAVAAASTAVQAASTATTAATAAAQSEQVATTAAATAEAAKQLAVTSAATAQAAATTATTAAAEATQSASNAAASEAIVEAAKDAAVAAAAAASASEIASAASEAAALAAKVAAEGYRDEVMSALNGISGTAFKGSWEPTVSYSGGDTVWFGGIVWQAISSNPPVGVVPSQGSDWASLVTAPNFSPNFTGIPTVPTPEQWNETTQIANTEWVLDHIKKRIPFDELFWSSAYSYDSGNISQADYTFVGTPAIKVREAFAYNAGNIDSISYSLSKDGGVTYTNLGSHAIGYDGSGNISQIIWS